MILIWGIPGDRPVAAVLAELAQPYFLLNQHESLEASLEMRVDGRVTGTIKTRGGCVALEAVRAAYIRPYDSGRLPAIQAAGCDSVEEAQVRVLDDALLAWCEITTALVINRPSHMASNGSKPYQAALIQQSGFTIPETLVTTDSVALEAFVDEHKQVIYKSVSGVRSIVSRLTAGHSARLGDLTSCPTQFQAYVGGLDHRVHVVGDDVFACAIQSGADDYRYPLGADDQPEIEEVRLPIEIEDRCRLLAKGLGLLVAGIDLRRTFSGDWCCFEVNPSPGFTYYEASTGQPIARAVARLLMNAC